MRTTPYFLTVDGVTLPLATWATETNQPYRRLFERMIHGWTDEAIVKGKRYARQTKASTGTRPSTEEEK